MTIKEYLESRVIPTGMIEQWKQAGKVALVLTAINTVAYLTGSYVTVLAAESDAEKINDAADNAVAIVRML
jgi:hypothetical protein